MKTYEIIRHYSNGYPKKLIAEGLTLGEAQEHCKDPETSSSTCSAKVQQGEQACEWFDGYEEE